MRSSGQGYCNHELTAAVVPAPTRGQAGQDGEDDLQAPPLTEKLLAFDS